MLAVFTERMQRDGQRRKIREDFHNTGTRPKLEKGAEGKAIKEKRERASPAGEWVAGKTQRYSFGMLERQIRNPSIRKVCVWTGVEVAHGQKTDTYHST